MRHFSYFIALVVAMLLAGFAWWAYTPLNLAEQNIPIEFTIVPGSSARAAANTIVNAGVPIDPTLLSLLARVTGKAVQIKAGTYALEANTTPLALLDKMTRGEVMQFNVMIPEGWTFKQMRMAIAADPLLVPTTLEWSDEQIMQGIGASETQAEGWFFPDTYLFARGTSDIEIFKRAYQAQQKKLAEAWAQRVADLPLKTAYEALILASIVEKETGRAQDRAMIAAVFINRLKRGMPLQSDPTVIYGIQDFDGNLRKPDLLRATPYNTYTRLGLPPTPICLPGTAALMAVLYPAKTDALYFVSRGDGTSQFSDNLLDHNRAVNRYQRGAR